MSASSSIEPSAPTTTSPPPPTRTRWTAGRVIAVVVGVLIGLVSLGLLSAGGWATWATNTQRDSAGFLTATTHTISTAGHAIVSDQIGELSTSTPAAVLGNTRVRATSTNPTGAVFIGIGRSAVVNAYLTGVDRTVVTDWYPLDLKQQTSLGRAPQAPPGAAHIWAVQTSGTGTQSLIWRPESGTWTIVVMTPDASPGVSVKADVGAEVPDLAWFAVGCFVAGGLLLGAAILLIALPMRRAWKGQ